jgi:hypothetical protein
MKIRTKCIEENRIALDEKEMDLLKECSWFIDNLMNELHAMGNGDVTLFCHGVDNDKDCCDTYATKYEFYDKLEDVSATLNDLLMADEVIVKGEDEY